jgi:hypothetical protein
MIICKPWENVAVAAVASPTRTAWPSYRQCGTPNSLPVHRDKAIDARRRLLHTLHLVPSELQTQTPRSFDELRKEFAS